MLFISYRCAIYHLKLDFSVWIIFLWVCVDIPLNIQSTVVLSQIDTLCFLKAKAEI